nr:unnamed protein product [Callosobruchus analis]
MAEYFESFPEEITKWEILRAMVDLDIDDPQPGPSKEIPSVQLLPRQDIMRYGCIPKMDQVVYTKCKECKLVFNPRDILSHKSCSAKTITTTPHSSKKKVKNKGSSSKRPGSNVRRRPQPKESASASNSNAPVPVSVPSASSSSTPATVPVAASTQPVVEMAMEKVTSSPAVKTTTVTTTTTATSSTKSEMAVSMSGSSKGHSAHSQKSHHASSATSSSSGHSNHGHSGNSSSSSSSRHRKSRKSNSSFRVAAKEFDPDIHCGVVEPGKGPCTRSVTCSNHRVRKIPFRRVRLKYMLHAVCIIQLRKLVPGRSKDILQLIAEKNTSKEQAPSPNGGLPEEKDSFSQNTTCVPLAEANAKTNEPDKPKAAPPPTTLPKANDITSYPRQTTLHSSDKNGNTTDMENKSYEDLNDPIIVEDSDEDVIINFLPMSPVSDVAPVQAWILDKQNYYMCLLQCLKSAPGTNHLHHSMIEVSKEDHEKITTTPSVLLPIVNSSVNQYRSHPKPVAIPTYSTKKTVRSPNKVNCKRVATEKLNTVENKQFHLSIK